MGLMQTITKDTLHVIGHTRAATQGTPLNNSNNHPILDENWIGIHNGVIYNDGLLASQYGTSAEVDSAVIFSMLNAETKDRPIGRKRFATLMSKLAGSFAVAATDLRTDRLFLARNHNPIFLLLKDGCLWFNSVSAHLKTVFGGDAKPQSMLRDAVMLLTTANANGTPLRSYPLRQGAKSYDPLPYDIISPSVYEYIEEVRRKRSRPANKLNALRRITRT